MKKIGFFILLMWLVLGRVFGQDRIDWDQIKAAPGSNYIPVSNVSGDGVWTAINAILSGANSVYGTGNAQSAAYWLNDSTLTFSTWYFDAGQFGTTTSPSYKFDMGNTTSGMRIPVGTDAQRPTGAAGVFRYNTTYAAPRPEFYNTDSWNPLVYGTGASGKSAAWSSTGELTTRNYLAGSSRIITVDAGGNGDYTTISNGLAAAAALTPSSSAPVLVLVYPGLYTEGLTITTSYTSLVAYRSESVIVRNGNLNVLTVNSGLTNVVVAGFRFVQQTNNNGISIVDLQGGTLFENNRVEATNALNTINIQNANCVVQNNYFYSSGASAGRGAVSCNAAAIVQGNVINAQGSGSAIGTVSAGVFSNNNFVAGTINSVSGGTWYNMTFSNVTSTGLSGGTFFGCTFYATANNTAAVIATGSISFYGCNLLQSYNAGSGSGYGLRITAAGITVNMYGGMISHADILPVSLNYSIANTSGGSATVNLRGTKVYGLVDFTNLSITGLHEFHQDAATSPHNYTVRADRFTSISNTSAAYSIDFSGVTNSGFRLPNVATASLPTGSAGVELFRTDTLTHSWYDGSAWQQTASRAWARSTFALAAAGYTGWTLAGDSGTQTIASGNTATFTGGWGIVTAASATDVLTIRADSSEVATQYDLTQVATLYTQDGTISSSSRTVTIPVSGELYIQNPGGTMIQFWDETSATIRNASTYVSSDAGAVYGEMNLGVRKDGTASTSNNIYFTLTGTSSRISGLEVFLDSTRLRAGTGVITMFPSGLKLVGGNTAARPTGANYLIRGNSDTTALEAYYNGAWETLADRDWVRANAGATYTFSNGLTNTAGTVKLGGTLTGATSIATGSNTMTVSTSTAGTTPFAVTATTGTAMTIDGTSGAGLVASTTGSNPSVKAASHTTATNSIIGVIQAQRTTTGTAAAGLGAAIDFPVQTDAGALPNIGRVILELTTATGGAHASEMELWTSASGSLAKAATLTSTTAVFEGTARLGGSSGPLISYGTGTPEGAVTAGVGSLFLRTDGGAGTTLYVKESGTGNTGWVAK